MSPNEVVVHKAKSDSFTTLGFKPGDARSQTVSGMREMSPGCDTAGW